MQEVLNEKIALVSVNISTFSGYRRATRDHIAALGGSLPKCGAITEGSIKVFPCDGTKDLQTVRRGLFRKLQAHGIRALGSQNVFAVLTDDLPCIEKEIDDAKTDFAGQISVLDANYETIFDAHVVANSEAATIIRSLKVERSDAIARCRFSTNVFKITPFVREGETEAENVEGIVRGLGRQLYEEISSDMEKLAKNDAFARQKVGQKTLRPIKASIAKMTKMSFLDSTVEGAVKLVNETLKGLPSEGYIQGPEFLTLVRLMELLSDTDELLNAASKVTNGVSVEDVMFPPVAVQAVVESVAVVDSTATNQDVLPEVAVDIAEPVAKAVERAEQTESVVVPPVVGQQAMDFAPKPVVVKQPPKVVSVAVPALPKTQPAVPLLRPQGTLKSNALMF